MSKNILIFSDGTGQAGGVHPDQRLSNIYKLYRAARSGPDSPIDPKKQIAFYDPGLGSADIDGPIWLQPVEFVRKLLSSATGTGFSRNVTDCYEAILKFYEPGDKIFIFGFSRGAYTARTVAGVMNLCGVPTQDQDGRPIPKHGPRLREIAKEAVSSVYEHGSGRPRGKYEDEREELAKRFRVKYKTQDNQETNIRGDVAPYFIGVFDTVAALGTSGGKRVGILVIAALFGALLATVVAGIVSCLTGLVFWKVFLGLVVLIGFLAGRLYFRAHFRIIRDWPKFGSSKWHFAGWRSKHYDKFLDPRVSYGRHAQAIDETRRDFARVGWGSHRDVKNNQADWLIQKWFAGNHSDIGGSYPESESRLSDIALQWMAEEATKIPHPILLDGQKLHLYPDSSAMQHCEVEATRNSLPKWIPNWLRFSWPEEVRSRARIAGCHSSVLERIKLKQIYKLGTAQTYRPEALKDDPKFIDITSLQSNLTDAGK